MAEDAGAGGSDRAGVPSGSPVHPEGSTTAVVPPSTIDRASAEDLMSLAADSGSAPMQVGAVLLFSLRDPIDVPEVLATLQERLPAVPRLRRRLMRAPLGGGRPVWTDDPTFRLSNHIAVIRSRGEDLEREALDEAARLVTTRLSRRRPLWAARLIVAEDAAAPGAALVLVFHHVLADGIAGLAVLSALTDGADPVQDPAFPRPAPTSRLLRADAWEERWRRLRAVPSATRRSAGGLLLLAPTLRRRAARVSLNRPTGPQRRFETVSCELSTVRAAGAASGATINDVILAAAAGAISTLLSSRGEHVEELTISVPFSSARAGTSQLGNHSGVVPVVVPTSGTFEDRVRAVHDATSRAKQGDRGSSAAILGPVFRLLAGARLFRSFIDHQRMVHTIVTNLRGPDHLLWLAGLSIRQVIPLSVATGNIVVAFAAASYADRLTITLVADPGAVPDLAILTRALLEQLDALHVPAGNSG